MQVYLETRSMEKPHEVTINESVVLVAKNIHVVEVEYDDERHSEWEYDLTVYTPTEYIDVLSRRNSELTQQVVNTQLALCDVYEMMGE